MQIGTVYHQQFKNGDRTYFKPTHRLKNGNWAGLVLDGGAAGRSKNKPKKQSVAWVDLWRETPNAEIPAQLRD